LTPRRDLVLVTAGFELEGGGRATVGRLLAGACSNFARREQVGFRVLSLRGTDPLIPGITVRGFHGSRSGLALATVRAALRRPRPALVFDLLGLARPLAFLPRSIRPPYLVALHGLEIWRPLSPLSGCSLREASLRLACSRHTRDRAREFVGRIASKFEVLPLALEERPADGVVDTALLERLGSGFLLMAGRMSVSERYKGHDQVLIAFQEVLRQVPGARIVVAGGGDDRARLEAVAAGNGLGEKVAFTGFVSEATLSELFGRCAGFVMPSRGEGFGLVYLEAMRAGKPCIAATGSAAEEIIEDGTTGFLVDPDDQRALSESLVRLLAEPGLARRLGEAGRARWQERFSLQRYRAGLEAYLDRLTAVDHVRH